MIHTEQVLRNVIATIRQLREQTGSSVHALVWGVWGNGKTFSAKNLTKEARDVFYYKAPAEEITPSRLTKGISLACGAGIRQTRESTLDLLKFTISTLKLKPILIIDEAQRILRRPLLLNELKDLAEDSDIGLCFVFLGDQSLPKVVQSTPHSIYRRVVIKKELEVITQESIKHVLEEKKVKGDIEGFYAMAKERGWTTLDIYFIVSVLQKIKAEATQENILKASKILGR